MNRLARRLAAECRFEAKFLAVGCGAATLTAWSIYADYPEWAITLACLGAFLAFIAATLCREAKALESLADDTEQEDEP